MASLSSLSNMSPATSDFLGPIYLFIFPVYFSLIFHNMYQVPFFASVGPVRMLEGTEQRTERFLM